MWALDDVSPDPNHKEEKMKKFIFIIATFMLMLIFIGCYATMTPEQRRETYDLRGSVGNSPFVGATSPGARDLAWFQMYGP
jgi:hypothetical protein